MAIVSSTFIVEHAQIDGRRYVHEYHTDDTGEVHTDGPFLAAVDTDHNAVMLARVPQIEAQIAEAVIESKRQADEGTAKAKERAYLDGLSDADAKRIIGYTTDQLKAVREVIR